MVGAGGYSVCASLVIGQNLVVSRPFVRYDDSPHPTRIPNFSH